VFGVLNLVADWKRMSRKRREAAGKVLRATTVVIAYFVLLHESTLQLLKKRCGD